MSRRPDSNIPTDFPMSLLRLGTTNNTVRLPRVARYIDEEHVDRFVKAGVLRLTPISQCRKYEDEQRLDAREGRLLVQATGRDGSTLTAVTLPSPSFYILCGSTVVDAAHRNLFGASSAFVISDAAEFAIAIAQALPDCKGVVHGPCFYAAEAVRRHELAEPLFREEPQREEDMERIEDAVRGIDQMESVFTKPPHPYSQQHEYRFIWFVGHDVHDYCTVESRAAARLCEKATFIS